MTNLTTLCARRFAIASTCVRHKIGLPDGNRTDRYSLQKYLGLHANADSSYHGRSSSTSPRPLLSHTGGLACRYLWHAQNKLASALPIRKGNISCWTWSAGRQCSSCGIECIYKKGITVGARNAHKGIWALRNCHTGVKSMQSQVQQTTIDLLSHT